MSSKLRRNIIICTILICIVGAVIIYCEFLRLDLEEKLAYELKSYDRQDSLEVIEINKEKGKDTKYVIEVHGERRSISEEIYNEYIDGYTALTLHYENLTIYIATDRFGYSFAESKIRQVQRIYFPWEKPVHFTMENVEEAIKVLIEDKPWKKESFTFDGHFYIGHALYDCIESGATKYIK